MGRRESTPELAACYRDHTGIHTLTGHARPTSINIGDGKSDEGVMPGFVIQSGGEAFFQSLDGTTYALGMDGCWYPCQVIGEFDLHSN